MSDQRPAVKEEVDGLTDLIEQVDSSPSSWRPWLSVSAVALGAFAFVTTEFLPVGLLPQIATELGVTPGTAGLMVTIPGIIAAVSAPAMMLGAGRIDRRLILLALSVLLLASNVISAFAPSFAIMLLGRAFLGAGLGGFWTLALTASGRLVHERHAAKAVATILTGVTFATVIGVPLGTLIASLASWRASFIATGVLAGIALVAQALLLPSLPSSVAIRFADLRALVGRLHMRKSLLLVALIFGAHFSSYTFIAPFLIQNADFSLSTVTPLLLGFGFVGFVSNFGMSAVVTKNLKASLLSIVVLLTLALVALPLLRHSHPGVIVAVLAWGVAFGAIPLCLSMWMQQAAPDLPEAGSALFISIIQVAIAVGSLAGGTVVDRIGVPADLWFGAALALAGVASIMSFRTKDTVASNVNVSAARAH
jgi:predicted MFS family arabinose efflux permease